MFPFHKSKLYAEFIYANASTILSRKPKINIRSKARVTSVSARIAVIAASGTDASNKQPISQGNHRITRNPSIMQTNAAAIIIYPAVWSNSHPLKMMNAR